MELGQKAALHPETWIYIIFFSKSFKLLNSPTWICLSAYLEGFTYLSMHDGTLLCARGVLCRVQRVVVTKFMHLHFPYDSLLSQKFRLKLYLIKYFF